MAKILAIANQKGGVSKTQTAIELSYWLTAHQKKVLVIDTDSQANMSDFLLFGGAPSGRMLPEILMSGSTITESDICHRAYDACTVDFVPSNVELGRIETRITGKMPKEFCIRHALSGVVQNYDYVIIDMAPSAELLCISSLVAADRVIVPSSLEKSSVAGTALMVELTNDLRQVAYLNSSVIIQGIIVTRYKKTLNTLFHSNELEKTYHSLVVHPFVRECIKVQQAFDQHLPVLAAYPDCTSAKDYDEVFNELFHNVK